MAAVGVRVIGLNLATFEGATFFGEDKRWDWSGPCNRRCRFATGDRDSAPAASLACMTKAEILELERDGDARGEEEVEEEEGEEGMTGC